MYTRASRTHSRHTPLQMMVAVITAASFLLSSIVPYSVTWAAQTTPELTSVGSARNSGPRSLAEAVTDLHPKHFALPDYLGTVRDAWAPAESAGPAETTVIHIQDAHCNYAAQHKVAEIIEYITAHYGIRTVNLEGGAKEYDLSLFARMYDPALRERVTDSFVTDGLINGAEYHAIMNPGATTLWGVEDPQLYIENLAVYRNSLAHKDEVDKALKSLTHILSNLKRHIYSPALLDLDAMHSQYQAGNLEFKEYISYLIAKAGEQSVPLADYPNIALLDQTVREESKIDFKKANNQRDELIEALQKALSRKTLEELAAKTVAFRMERISPKDFYDYLLGLSATAGIGKDSYAALEAYSAYLALYTAIDKSRTMQEFTLLEDAVRNELYRNGDERELVLLSKNLTLLKNLFAISLTKDDYRYYRQHEADFAMSHFTAFIGKTAPVFKIAARPDDATGKIDAYREELATFYDYSLKRDDAFLRNMKTGRRGAIIVTGGFHTENLCELFKKNDIPYVSIMPSFRNDEGYHSPYFPLLGGALPRVEAQLYTVFSSQPREAPRSTIQICTMLADNDMVRRVWTAAGISSFRAAASARETVDQGFRLEVRDGARTILTFGEELGDAAPVITLSLSDFIARVTENKPLGGFMGPYEAASQATYAQKPGGTEGTITVMIRPIEGVDKGKDRSVTLTARPIPEAVLAKSLAAMKALAANDPLTLKIIDWFERSHAEEPWSILMMPDYEEYGFNEIYGIGQQGLIAITASLMTNPAALFHEIGEAAMAARNANGTPLFSYADVVNSLTDDANIDWINAHIAKGSRGGLLNHYALRAKQRELFAGIDTQLTQEIKTMRPATVDGASSLSGDTTIQAAMRAQDEADANEGKARLTVIALQKELSDAKASGADQGSIAAVDQRLADARQALLAAERAVVMAEDLLSEAQAVKKTAAAAQPLVRSARPLDSTTDGGIGRARYERMIANTNTVERLNLARFHVLAYRQALYMSDELAADLLDQIDAKIAALAGKTGQKTAVSKPAEEKKEVIATLEGDIGQATEALTPLRQRFITDAALFLDAHLQEIAELVAPEATRFTIDVNRIKFLGFGTIKNVMAVTAQTDRGEITFCVKMTSTSGQSPDAIKANIADETKVYDAYQNLAGLTARNLKTFYLDLNPNDPSSIRLFSDGVFAVQITDFVKGPTMDKVTDMASHQAFIEAVIRIWLRTYNPATGQGISISDLKGANFVLNEANDPRFEKIVCVDLGNKYDYALRDLIQHMRKTIIDELAETLTAQGKTVDRKTLEAELLASILNGIDTFLSVEGATMTPAERGEIERVRDSAAALLASEGYMPAQAPVIDQDMAPTEPASPAGATLDTILSENTWLKPTTRDALNAAVEKARSAGVEKEAVETISYVTGAVGAAHETLPYVNISVTAKPVYIFMSQSSALCRSDILKSQLQKVWKATRNADGMDQFTVGNINVIWYDGTIADLEKRMAQAGGLAHTNTLVYLDEVNNSAEAVASFKTRAQQSASATVIGEALQKNGEPGYYTVSAHIVGALAALDIARGNTDPDLLEKAARVFAALSGNKAGSLTADQLVKAIIKNELKILLPPAGKIEISKNMEGAFRAEEAMMKSL